MLGTATLFSVFRQHALPILMEQPFIHVDGLLVMTAQVVNRCKRTLHDEVELLIACFHIYSSAILPDHRQCQSSSDGTTSNASHR